MKPMSPRRHPRVPLRYVVLLALGVILSVGACFLWMAGIGAVWLRMAGSIIALAGLSGIAVRFMLRSIAADTCASDHWRRYHTLLETTHDGIFFLDRNLKITFATTHAARHLGAHETAIIGADARAILPDNAIDLARSILDGSRSGSHREASASEHRVTLRFTGAWLSLWFAPMRDDSGVVTGVMGILRDITEHKRTEEDLDAYAEINRSLMKGLPYGMDIIDVDGNILHFSEKFEEILGKDAIGKKCWDIYRADRRRCEGCPLEHGLEPGQLKVVEVDDIIEGRTFSITHIGMWYRGRKAVLQMFSDITENKRLEQRLKHISSHDILTGLPNRMLLTDRLGQAMARSRRYKKFVALMMLDLDRFKEINDAMGHEKGDVLLRAVAQRLSKCVRETDTITRLGGDEFVVIFTDITDAKDVERVVQKVGESFAAPFDIDGQEVYTTASIGVSIYPADGETIDLLLKNVEIAMYHAKSQGPGNFQFFNKAMGITAFERKTIENSLRKAIERGEFMVYYQPQVRLADWRIIGMEALIRWKHPELGVVAPSKFIPLAEETGLIVPIGDWVLKTACEQNVARQDAGLSPVTVAVNLSPREFSQRTLVERIANTLRETRLDPKWLELEITESTAMQSIENTVAILEQLSQLGIHISIDDFGTGYSSLNYLKKFPLTRLKIDRSFIQDIVEDPDDAEIVKAIVAMAHSLKLEVVAEGVENEEQLMYLRSLECDHVQGYLFSKPLPSNEFDAIDTAIGRRWNSRDDGI